MSASEKEPGLMGGASLAYDVRGAGHPLVLIHDDSVDRRLWDDQMNAFADRFRVVRYDQRNHGGSPRCTGEYDADRDLLNLLEALDIGTAHLVGAGLGGTIAVEFALRHPRRVSALVLAASGVSGHMPDLSELFRALASGMKAFMSVLRGGDPAPFIDRLLASPATPRRDAGRALLRWMLLDNAHVFTQFPPGPAFPKLLDPPSVGRLGEIGVPTLVMVGERDLGNVKRFADILQQGIPGATKVTVAGAGHFPNLDDPEFFNDTVIQFLTVTRSSPPADP